MPFNIKFGDIAKKIGETTKKGITKAGISLQKSKEIKRKKLEYLSELSQHDLVNLYKRSSNYQLDALVSNISDTKQTNPNKLRKDQLIETLTNVSDGKIYEYLIAIRKRERAMKFQMEIEQINKRYENEFSKVDGTDVSLASKTEMTILDDVISVLRRLNFNVKDSYNEKEYQQQAKLFFDGAKIALENQFKHFSVKVDREVPVSSETNEAIDLMVIVGDFKIGIEMKTAVDTTSVSQRLLGQIDRYIGFCDALIILIVFENYDTITVKKILEKGHQLGKMIRVITPEKMYT